MRRAASALFATAMLAAGSASGQSKTGTTIGQFVSIEPSARIAAMGNAGVALDGIQAVYYNPAALGPLDHPAVQLTHSFWFAGISYDYVGVILPVSGWGTFFGSVTALNSGDIAVRTVEHPLGTGESYSVSDLALGVGFGREITDRFGVGGQVNYLTETIWHSSMRIVTFSVGTDYRLTDSGIRLGSSLTNFGTKARFEGRDLAIQFDRDPDRYGDNSALPANQFADEFSVPILFRVGMSFPRRLSDSSQLVAVVDAFHPSDNTESVSAGWEWTWKDSLWLRTGYQHLFERDTELGLTAGVGVRGGLGGERRFHLDYAWAYHVRLQETHRLTFVLTL